MCSNMYASTCIYSLLLILISAKILFPTFECSHNCTNKANLTILEIMQIFGCYNNHIITRTHVLHFTQRAHFTVFVEISHDKHLSAKLTTQRALLAQTSQQLPMSYIHISQWQCTFCARYVYIC